MTTPEPCAHGHARECAHDSEYGSSENGSGKPSKAPVLLAVCAGYAAQRFHKASLALLAAVVLAYQLLGTAGEWIMKSDFYAACQDFRIGLPGMLLQIFGGWLVINKLTSR